jgi:hypothetical protein
MGKKGSSQTSSSYTPTPTEDALEKLALQYETNIMPTAENLNSQAGNLLTNSLGTTQVDYSNLLNNAENNINSATTGLTNLTNGTLPSAYTENEDKQIKSSVNNSMGSLLQNLGTNGVLNSSVTSQGIQGINNAAANAEANNYDNDISNLSSLYSSLLNSAGTGISTAAAGQEAALAPALSLWNASLGLDNSDNAALSSIAGSGTKTQTSSSSPGSSGFLSGILSGLASNASLFCFAGDTNIKTPSGNKAIKDIVKGDTIITPVGDAEEAVSDVMTPHYSHVYALVTDKGNVLMTDTQPLMKDDGTFATVKELTVGTALKGMGNIVNIIYAGDKLVYDLKTPSAEYYANGFVAKAGTTEW